jgi:hypothetical protein
MLVVITPADRPVEAGEDTTVGRRRKALSAVIHTILRDLCI